MHLRAHLSLALAFLIAAPSLLNLSALLDYSLRYSYYVNELCVNQDRPEMQCNGQCHLVKRSGMSVPKLVRSNKRPEPQAPERPALKDWDALAIVRGAAIHLDSTVPFQNQRSYRGDVPQLTSLKPNIPTPPPELALF